MTPVRHYFEALNTVDHRTPIPATGLYVHRLLSKFNRLQLASVARAREVLGPLADRLILGNFFKHDFAANQYGLIYERGLLCSLPPARWPDYVARMAALIPPGGRLVGLFLDGEEPEPPPFPLTQDAAAALFRGRFRLSRDEPVNEKSVAVYQGMEHWQEWERLAD